MYRACRITVMSTESCEAICSVFNEQTSTVPMMQIDSPATNWFRAWKIAIVGVREGVVERTSRARAYTTPVKRRIEGGESSITPVDRIARGIMGRARAMMEIIFREVLIITIDRIFMEMAPATVIRRALSR